MLVQAKDGAARRFYLGCADFVEWPEGGGMLWLGVETVVGGWGECGRFSAKPEEWSLPQKLGRAAMGTKLPFVASAQNLLAVAA